MRHLITRSIFPSPEPAARETHGAWSRQAAQLVGLQQTPLSHALDFSIVVSVLHCIKSSAGASSGKLEQERSKGRKHTYCAAGQKLFDWQWLGQALDHQYAACEALLAWCTCCPSSPRQYSSCMFICAHMNKHDSIQKAFFSQCCRLTHDCSKSWLAPQLRCQT